MYSDSKMTQSKYPPPYNNSLNSSKKKERKKEIQTSNYTELL